MGQLAPVLHGGMGKAARPATAGGAKGTLGIHHGVARADKALQESAQPSQTTVAVAPTKAVAAAKPAPSESSTWDQTSLIGKIFIAFGALLTVASAARMFMA